VNRRGPQALVVAAIFATLAFVVTALIPATGLALFMVVMGIGAVVGVALQTALAGAVILMAALASTAGLLAVGRFTYLGDNWWVLPLIATASTAAIGALASFSSGRRARIDMWLGGLGAGVLGLWTGMIFGAFGLPVLIASFAFGALPPRAASAGGVLTSAGAWLVIGELRLVEACNAVNRSPQGRCTHEDVTTKVIFEVTILALGIALTTYAFARRQTA
jgi:hypothetical protein